MPQPRLWVVVVTFGWMIAQCVLGTFIIFESESDLVKILTGTLIMLCLVPVFIIAMQDESLKILTTMDNEPFER